MQATPTGCSENCLCMFLGSICLLMRTQWNRSCLFFSLTRWLKYTEHSNLLCILPSDFLRIWTRISQKSCLLLWAVAMNEWRYFSYLEWKSTCHYFQIWLHRANWYKFYFNIWVYQRRNSLCLLEECKRPFAMSDFSCNHIQFYCCLCSSSTICQSSDEACVYITTEISL